MAIREKKVFVTDDLKEHATLEAAEFHEKFRQLVEDLSKACDFNRAEYTSAEEVVQWFQEYFYLIPKGSGQLMAMTARLDMMYSAYEDIRTNCPLLLGTSQDEYNSALEVLKTSLFDLRNRFGIKE